jgi:hypothetical protein
VADEDGLIIVKELILSLNWKTWDDGAGHFRYAPGNEIYASPCSPEDEGTACDKKNNAHKEQNQVRPGRHFVGILERNDPEGREKHEDTGGEEGNAKDRKAAASFADLYQLRIDLFDLWINESVLIILSMCLPLQELVLRPIRSPRSRIGCDCLTWTTSHQNKVTIYNARRI